MKLKTRNQQRKSTKPKADALKRSIKSISLQPGKLFKKGEKRTQITNLISEIKEGTLVPFPLTLKGQSMNKYCEQLYANKFDNLDEMDQFQRDIH